MFSSQVEISSKSFVSLEIRSWHDVIVMFRFRLEHGRRESNSGSGGQGPMVNVDCTQTHTPTAAVCQAACFHTLPELGTVRAKNDAHWSGRHMSREIQWRSHGGDNGRRIKTPIITEKKKVVNKNCKIHLQI